jgi:hypothetical protein
LSRRHSLLSSEVGRSATKCAGQAIGRSRGGLTTKIHVLVDALGNPIEVMLTPGQPTMKEHMMFAFKARSASRDTETDLARATSILSSIEAAPESTIAACRADIAHQ